MKSTDYTNTILTVIAVCLVLIVIELASFTPVNANNAVIDVNIKEVAGSTVFRNVPVEIKE
jgi:hypothetical protein